MSVTGTLLLDLTTVPPADAYLCCRDVHLVPTGAPVVLRVGTLHPDLRVIDLLAQHTSRLRIDVQTDSPTVLRSWLAALRAGDPLADPGVNAGVTA